MADPSFEPSQPVLALMGACDRDDPAAAREWLAPELLDEITRSQEGWGPWWEDVKLRLSGVDLSEWAVSMSGLARHAMWGHGHRVTLAPSEDVRPEPGGVTVEGTPYEVTTVEGRSASATTFWTVETTEGWRLRGFGVD